MIFVPTLLLLQLAISCFVSFYTFIIIEAIHELRRCRRECPEGGYYQRFNFAYHIAARYLKYAITVEKLPQGGYNVYPYKSSSWSNYDGR